MEIALRSCQVSSTLLAFRERARACPAASQGRLPGGRTSTMAGHRFKTGDKGAANAAPMAFNHRYPEPLDEPPPDAEPIPPELPFPEPPQPDQVPGQAPVRVSGRHNRRLMLS